VLSRRRMNWKFDFSPETSDIVAVDERCYCWRREYNQIKEQRWILASACGVWDDAKPELIAQNSSLGACSFSPVPRLSFTLEHHDFMSMEYTHSM
jgi:hypothetical protein